MAIVVATILLGACRPCDWTLAECGDDDDGGAAECVPPDEADNVASTEICEESG